jgi:hypothetical protein
MGLLCFQFPFFQKLLMGFRRTIMKRVGPFVAGNFQAAIIAFEKPMMHLVMESSQRQPVLAAKNQTFITGMRGCSRQGASIAPTRVLYWYCDDAGNAHADKAAASGLAS